MRGPFKQRATAPPSQKAVAKGDGPPLEAEFTPPNHNPAAGGWVMIKGAAAIEGGPAFHRNRPPSQGPRSGPPVDKAASIFDHTGQIYWSNTRCREVPRGPRVDKRATEGHGRIFNLS